MSDQDTAPPDTPERARREPSSRRALVREDLLEVAARMFDEQGFDRVSMAMIAREMGMGRSAIYHYFPSKDDILASIVESEALAPVGRIQKVAADTSRSATDRLRHIIRDGVERRLSQGSRFVRLARLEAQIPPHLRQDYDQSRRAIYTVYLGLIKDGIETGEFRAVDPNVSAFAIIGMANWTSRWFRPDGRLSPEEVAEIITDLALTSLRGAETTDERMAALRARLGEVIGDLSDIANAAGPGDLF